MLYEIEKTMTFDAAHHLPYYKGHCHNVHGHTWRVTVIIRSPELLSNGTNEGMVIDFSEIVNLINSRFDHQDLNKNMDNPTAENIAYYIFNMLEKFLSFKPAYIYSVSVWETEGSKAMYGRME